MPNLSLNPVAIDYNVRVTDVAIILATIMGPIFAVWASDYRRKKEEQRERRAKIFRALMGTRSLPAAPAQVEAINQIELEFNSNAPSDRAVIEAWRLYRAHLDSGPVNDMWHQRRSDLQTALLAAISSALGYAFNRADIQQGVYYPVAHSDADSENQKSRKLWLEILEGKRALPMTDHVSPPVTPPTGATPRPTR
jgi:hypothetical protein